METGVTFTIWGLGGVAAVTLVVQLLKKLIVDKQGETQVKDRWAVAASVGVGLVLSAVAYFATLHNLVETISNVLGAGLLAGLAACGVYSGLKPRPPA